MGATPRPLWLAHRHESANLRQFGEVSSSFWGPSLKSARRAPQPSVGPSTHLCAPLQPRPPVPADAAPPAIQIRPRQGGACGEPVHEAPHERREPLRETRSWTLHAVSKCFARYSRRTRHALRALRAGSALAHSHSDTLSSPDRAPQRTSPSRVTLYESAQIRRRLDTKPSYDASERAMCSTNRHGSRDTMGYGT